MRRSALLAPDREEGPDRFICPISLAMLGAQQQSRPQRASLLWPVLVSSLVLIRLEGACGWVLPVRKAGATAFMPSIAQQQSCHLQQRQHATSGARRLWNAPATTENSVEAVSFVQTELRKEAMRLHTRDQAKEGEQEAQTPFTKWEPKRQDYLQFLVDSKLVYETLEEIVQKDPALAAFRNTGLERAKVLEKDIAWVAATYSDVTLPAVGSYGKEYAAVLKELASSPERLPAFMCHYYNHYFAHTAGGRMIGKKMAAMFLDNHELDFYKWEGDVKALLDVVRRKIDAMAVTWTPTEREACVKETKATFQYGGSLLRYIAGPSAH